VNMQEAVRSVLIQYATFAGRARRSEYWFWVLATSLLSILITIFDMFIDTQIIDWVIIVITAVPNFSVGARRLHDINRSGWWQLLFLLPIVGWILLLVWFATDGHPGQNEHGTNPKGQAAGPYSSPVPTV
jgi:uncharacterized membrane protein YhaH (DUF805 family)